MHELDRMEKRILALLQKNASLSSSEIAERLGSSQSPIWRRINNLEKSGIIAKKVALADNKKLGIGIVVFVRIKMTQHGRQALSEFENKICKFPQVQECQLLLGESDFRLRVIAKDLDNYEKFLRENLMQMNGVREIVSSVVVRSAKDTREIPLELM
ncbi:hypothetical protein MNBD_ALPHA08-221 [hydrothermal vent metagenome]|uniref:HTH asnC-type domain-containing protein n=1 Tax=hydrothermal vent metagenome TaxID=652676 RepID=A0A3B0RWS5_9ZZZZ